jgi:hypothetical protein
MANKPEHSTSHDGKISDCGNCKSHDYQDSLYGKRKRVHNPMVKDGKLRGYKCTVCGNVKDEIKGYVK